MNIVFGRQRDGLVDVSGGGDADGAAGAADKSNVFRQ